MEKNLKVFLDIVVLVVIHERSMHRYDYRDNSTRIWNSAQPLLPYHLLHCSEEEKLIVSTIDRAKVDYCLTPEGKEKYEKAFVAYNLSVQKMSRFVKTHVELDSPFTQSLKGRFELVDTT
jgi:DNA-binding PadR family transcriptional regulator